MAEGTISREEMLAGIVDKGQPIEWEAITDVMRWWIGGGHDADGCTTLDYKHGPRVMVVKAENGYGCLETLKLMLGGSIDKHADETEKQQARKCWTISGRSAIEFCRNMKEYVFLKRPQLEKMCEYPIDDLQIMQMKPVLGRNVTSGEHIIGVSVSDAFRQMGKAYNGNIRIALDKPDKLAYGCRWTSLANPINKEETQNKCREIEQKLRDMKHIEHLRITCDLPTPYVSGLVDGDGMLYLTSKSIFPRVSVGKKYAAICNALKRQYGGTVRYREQRGFSSYTWDLIGHFEAQYVIREILPYLIEKKTQAELILAMLTTDEPDKVRAEFQKTKGRQGANLREKLVKRLLEEDHSEVSQ